MVSRQVMGGAGLLIALGCSGLIGYGTELASAPVEAGRPFSFTVNAANGAEQNLWFEYEVEYLFDYAITGTFEMSAAGKPVDSWKLNLHEIGAPVSGARLSVSSSVRERGDRKLLHESVFLVTLPPQPVGTPYTLSGVFNTPEKTKLGALRLIVTD